MTFGNLVFFISGFAFCGLVSELLKRHKEDLAKIIKEGRSITLDSNAKIMEGENELIVFRGSSTLHIKDKRVVIEVENRSDIGYSLSLSAEAISHLSQVDVSKLSKVKKQQREQSCSPNELPVSEVKVNDSFK